MVHTNPEIFRKVLMQYVFLAKVIICVYIYIYTSLINRNWGEVSTYLVPPFPVSVPFKDPWVTASARQYMV